MFGFNNRQNVYYYWKDTKAKTSKYAIFLRLDAFWSNSGNVWKIPNLLHGMENILQTLHIEQFMLSRCGFRSQNTGGSNLLALCACREAHRRELICTRGAVLYDSWTCNNVRYVAVIASYCAAATVLQNASYVINSTPWLTWLARSPVGYVCEDGNG